MNNKLKVLMAVLLVLICGVCVALIYNIPKDKSPKGGEPLSIFDAYMKQRGWDGKVPNRVLEPVEHNRHFDLMSQVSNIELMTPYREPIPVKWTFNTSGYGFCDELSYNYYEESVKASYVLARTYKDSIFVANPTKADDDITSMSSFASTLAYSPQTAANAMRKCGFECNIYKPTITDKDFNHVAFVIGHKVIDCQYVVAIWIRGTKNPNEWKGNFEIGKGSTHLGFDLATDEVEKALFSYMEKNNIGANVRFWVTGHSRGAAIANLLGARLKELYDESKIIDYTFATPRVSTSAKKKGYTFIKNYIGETDFVCELAPKAWGYKRYGTDYILKIDDEVKVDFKGLTRKTLKPLTVSEKNKLLNSFLDYAGDGPEDYYKSGLLSSSAATNLKSIMPKLVSDNNGENVLGLGDVLLKRSIGLAKLVSNLILYNSNLKHSHCMTTYMVLLDKSEK